MNLNNRLLKFTMLIAVLTLVVSACSGDSPTGPAGGSGPELELYLQTETGPRLITSGGLVGTQPEFEVRAADRSRIEVLEYRVDNGAWQSLAAHGLYRVNFVPAVPLTGTGATLELRATNHDGESSGLSADLRVDSQHPVIEAFTVYGDDYLGNADSVVFPLLDENDLPMHRIEIFALASDLGFGSADVTILLESGDEVVHSTTGAHFDFLIQSNALDDGLYRYQLSAVDGAGNRSEPVSFVVNAVAAVVVP